MESVDPRPTAQPRGSDLIVLGGSVTGEGALRPLPMKTIRVHGASLAGLNAFVVTIEARAEAKKDEGPEFHLTGLPDPILRESRGRLMCIMNAARLWLGPVRIYMNLVPAGRKKSGEALDLALVLAAATAGGTWIRAR